MVKQSVTKGKLKIGLLGLIILCMLILTSLYNYLLFHSIAEIFGIVIACGIFMVAWNSRRIVENSYLLFLGIAYLFVALMDLIHTLSYKGMGVFPEYGANLATQLWIATRYIESISLLIAPLIISRKMEIRFVFISYIAVSSLLLGSIFYWNIFPACFVDGTGLTPFKKISEYIISAILASSIFLLFRKQKEFNTEVFHLLVASVSITILSELSFTFYVHAYGFSNLTGHFLKIISFHLIYRAIIANSLMKPYNVLFRNLKQSEANLRKFKFISDNSNDAHFLLDRNGKIQYVNKSACKMLGYSEQELLTFEITDVDAIYNKAKFQDMFDLIQKERVSNIDTVNKKKDGNLFPSEVTVTGYRIDDKPYMFAALRDISGRVQSEEEQSRLQQRLEAQWEIARMVDTDEKTLSDLVLNELVSMTGSKYGFYGFFNKDESIMTSYSWTKEVMKDCKIYEKPVEFPIEKSGVWGNAVRERKTIIINNYRNGNYPNKKGLPEGHVPINRILAVPIFRYNHIVALGAVADKANDYTEKDAEQMNAFLHSAQIIQDKRRAEEELRKHRELLMELVEERTYELRRINEELQQEIAERKLAEAEALRASQLASLGELAAGVAHEINNPVNGIINYTQILFNKSEAGSKEHDIAGRIIREGDRIADIVKSLLSFARDNKDKKHPVHIHEIISESLALTETQIKKDGIHLRVKVSPDLPKIVAQPQQIEQVFLNIISNARYALNQKYPEAHDNKVLEITADKAIINNNRHIRTIFYDKGTGIPDEIQGKIINPFFSTKSDSQGTGLGLSISHGIIS
ncbi:MAG: GAF domain-containing protein, partial [Thermodesulfovibrionia bacterium]|nr:GAF domain-containing protein [Thermodesulfovibrionia bacterium]